MNVLTIPVEDSATNVVPKSRWSQELQCRIQSVSTGATAAPSFKFEWGELPISEEVYYWKAGINQVVVTSFGGWIVERGFTPPTELHFRNRILQAKLPAKWILEGVQPPTTACRLLAYKVWNHLYTKFRILPPRVSASVECGITLSYEHATNGKTLIVEIYNDLEVAALVNDSKKIVYSENIKGLDLDCTFLEFNV